MGYTIYKDEILTNIDFSNLNGIQDHNAISSVLNNNLTVSDDSEALFGELTVTDSDTGPYPCAYITIDVESNKAYNIKCDVFSGVSSSTKNASIMIIDGEFAENAEYKVAENGFGANTWGLTTLNFITKSNKLTIVLYCEENYAKFRKLKINSLSFPDISENKLYSLFNGYIENIDLLSEDMAYMSDIDTMNVVLNDNILGKYIEIDYSILDLGISSAITINGIQIPFVVGRNKFRIESDRNNIDIDSDNKIDLVIHHVNEVKDVLLDIELSVLLEDSSDDIVAESPILSLSGVANSLLSINNSDNITYIESFTGNTINASWLDNTSVRMRLIIADSSSMMNTYGNDVIGLGSGNLMTQIAYSTNDGLSWTYSIPDNFNIARIEGISDARELQFNANINAIYGYITAKYVEDMIIDLNFKNKDKYVESIPTILKGDSAEVEFNINGLILSVLNSNIPYIDFKDSNGNLYSDTSEFETFNSSFSINDNIIRVVPVGTVDDTVAGIYLKERTNIGDIYTVGVILSVSDITKEHRIVISNDNFIKDSWFTINDVDVNNNELTSIEFSFIAQSDISVISFLVGTENIIEIESLFIKSNVLQFIENPIKNYRFDTLTDITENSSVLGVSGGNNENNNDGYSFFEIDTLIGKDYEISTKIKCNDIDSGNEYHAKVLAISNDSIIGYTTELLTRNAFELKKMSVRADSNNMSIAYHSGVDIDVIFREPSAKEIERIELTENEKLEPVATISKKFEYVFNDSLPEHIKNRYPKFAQYMIMYGRFLDYTYGQIGYNLINLYDPKNLDEITLDSLLNQYFKDVIDENSILITTDNKKLFIELSKTILNLKMTKNAISFLFTNLRDYSYINSSGETINVESLKFTYEESEERWTPPESWFTDNPTTVPYEAYPQDSGCTPFAYTFKLDNDIETIQSVLAAVHPVGYVIEFIGENVFSESISIIDNVDIKASKVNTYDAKNTHNSNIIYSSDIITTVEDGVVI